MNLVFFVEPFIFLHKMIQYHVGYILSKGLLFRITILIMVVSFTVLLACNKIPCL